VSLHRLTSITLGVPNVAETAAYYEDFGLAPVGDGATARFATAGPVRRPSNSASA